MFLYFDLDDGVAVISFPGALSCMRTGTGASQTATFCQVKTA